MENRIETYQRPVGQIQINVQLFEKEVFELTNMLLLFFLQQKILLTIRPISFLVVSSGNDFIIVS